MYKGIANVPKKAWKWRFCFPFLSFLSTPSFTSHPPLNSWLSAARVVCGHSFVRGGDFCLEPPFSSSSSSSPWNEWESSDGWPVALELRIARKWDMKLGTRFRLSAWAWQRVSGQGIWIGLNLLCYRQWLERAEERANKQAIKQVNSLCPASGLFQTSVPGWVW